LREEGVFCEKLSSWLSRKEVQVGRGSDHTVPDFCVKVAFEEEVVKSGAFDSGRGGWGEEWGGWV
jgi:hypothetical protein